MNADVNANSSHVDMQIESDSCYESMKDEKNRCQSKIGRGN